MKINRIEEFELTQAHKVGISQLFTEAFEGYPDDAIYYTQIPNFRLLAMENERIVGHLGVIHRMIAVNHNAYSVFGLADMCVAPEKQMRNLGSKVIDHASKLAKDHDIDFLVLTSEVNEFYSKNGFRTVFNPCRWLVLHNNESMGVFRRTLKDGLMVKEISGAPWPEGEADFMGHMF